MYYQEKVLVGSKTEGGYEKSPVHVILTYKDHHTLLLWRVTVFLSWFDSRHVFIATYRLQTCLSVIMRVTGSKCLLLAYTMDCVHLKHTHDREHTGAGYYCMHRRTNVEEVTTTRLELSLYTWGIHVIMYTGSVGSSQSVGQVEMMIVSSRKGAVDLCSCCLLAPICMPCV